MVEVVAQLGDPQAQLMSSAKLAPWLRVEHLEPETVQRALREERSLVRTWTMPGTLHLLRTTELQFWWGALSLDRLHLRPSWLHYSEIFAKELEQLITAVQLIRLLLLEPSQSAAELRSLVMRSSSAFREGAKNKRTDAVSAVDA